MGSWRLCLHSPDASLRPHDTGYRLEGFLHRERYPFWSGCFGGCHIENSTSVKGSGWEKTICSYLILQLVTMCYVKHFF